MFFIPRSYSQSVTVGNGTFGGTNILGPMFAVSTLDTAFSRQAYIYPRSLLYGLDHGDSISSLDFYAQANDTLVGDINLKIYLRMSLNDTFPRGTLNYKNEISKSNTVLVYNDDPKKIMNGTSGYKNFNFNIQRFRFDTLNGRNLEIIMFYYQTVRQPSTTDWLYESNFSILAFKSINEGKINYGKGLGPDTSAFNEIRKPHIRIHFPRHSNNLQVLNVYALGRVPLLANLKDSIKVRIGNRGKRNVSGKKLYMHIRGANVYTDSLSLKALNPWEDVIVNFANFKPDSIGEDTIFISLSPDDLKDDNYDTTVRLINYNVFSHCDPFLPNAGGIGFNGSTGDFVAKFYSDTGVYINQITVDFSSFGRSFRFGIWDASGPNGVPGKELFISDSFSSQGGTYFLPVIPRIKVGGGFYVGIRQISPFNVGFSFQEEDPIRPAAFYFTAPQGNSDWVPFSPGFPFKFNIQPRIQVADDVAPIAILSPYKDETVEYSLRDSLGPVARIINYGFADQNTPFEVRCKITNSFGITEYTNTKKITLKAGRDTLVKFDSTYEKYNLGDHKIEVSTHLPNDKITDNDVISHAFRIIVKHDVGVDIMFTPPDQQVYEYNLDTIRPTVRINNFGTTQKTFNVTFRIRNDTSVIYSETQLRSLSAESQEIISFSKHVPRVTGNYYAECFTSLKDTIPFNDTVRHSIRIIKSNDVGPIKINIPDTSQIYTMGGFFFAKVVLENFGNKNQLIPFVTHMRIYGTDGSEIFYDTSSTQLGGFSTTEISFKRFNIPLKYGRYKIFFQTGLQGDQEPLNDTLTAFFTVIPNLDLAPIKIQLPSKDTLIALETLPFKPEIRVKNYGSSTLNEIGPVVVQITNNSVPVYEDSVTINGKLTYQSEMNITLKKDFDLMQPGDYRIVVYTRLKGELIPINDTLRSRFFIRRYYDLALDTFSNFNNHQIFNFERTFYKPQFVIINNGTSSYPEKFDLNLSIYKDTAFLTSKTVSFDSINKSESFSVFIDSMMNLSETGNYKLCAKISASLDSYFPNDSFCWSYSVVKPYDLAIDSLIFPEKGPFVYHNKIYRPRLKATNLGSEDIVNTMIDLKIYETTNYIWRQSLFIDLDSGESKWILFDSTLSYSFTGSSKAQAIGYLNKDLDPLNDTVTIFYQVAKTSSNDPLRNSKTKVYPNPGRGKITLISNSDEEVELSLYTTSGYLIFNDHVFLDKDGLELDLKSSHDLGSGIYLLQITGNKTNEIHRLVLY